MEKVDEIAGRKALYRHRRAQDQRESRGRFLERLEGIAWGRDVTLSDLVSTIDSDRRHGNLSSAIRLFVLDYYRSQIPGHQSEHGTPREIMGGVRTAQPAMRAD